MIGELSFEQRYVAGTVRKVNAISVDIELARPLQGIRYARIYRNHYAAGHQWQEGQIVTRLFIYRLSAHANASNGHWFASQLWADDAHNPWHKDHPRQAHLGQVRAGVVIAHTSESAVVHFEQDELEAFLQISEVPDWIGKKLLDLVPLGTHLKAEVINVTPSRCAVDVSVKAYLARLERDQGKDIPEIGTGVSATPYLRLVNLPTETPVEHVAITSEASIWQGKFVLVLDNDKIFRHSLCNWLRQFGAQAWDADTAQYAEQLLQQHPISHVLLDYSIGSRSLQAELLALLRKHQRGDGPQLAVAIISGQDGDEAANYAARHQWPFMLKPLHFQAVNVWLREGIAAPFDRQAYQPAKFWEASRASAVDDIAQRAATWLKVMCQQGQAVAACWLRCYHPGYALVAEHGMGFAAFPLQKDVFMQGLAQSLVANVEGTGKPDQMERADVTPFRAIWPEPASRVLALPLPTIVGNAAPAQGVVVDDVLLVFARSQFTFFQTENTAWQNLLVWWQDLLALEMAQNRLQEESVFATQGRVHAATLHELRPLVQVFESSREWDQATALGWWASGKKAKNLIDSGLYNIKPDRAAQINLADRLQTLMENFIWQFADKRKICTLVYLPPADLNVCLPPEVFEQSLINLVDNATKFCKRRRWARVEVKIFVDATDAVCPLVLQVSDQGIGMTPEEQRHLFQPRHTASDQGGFGMGLYVSASLAKAVGGRLQITQNWRWSGCQFQLRLPLSWGQTQQTKRT